MYLHSGHLNNPYIPPPHHLQYTLIPSVHPHLFSTPYYSNGPLTTTALLNTLTMSTPYTPTLSLQYTPIPPIHPIPSIHLITVTVPSIPLPHPSIDTTLGTASLQHTLLYIIKHHNNTLNTTIGTAYTPYYNDAPTPDRLNTISTSCLQHPFPIPSSTPYYTLYNS